MKISPINNTPQQNQPAFNAKLGKGYEFAEFLRIKLTSKGRDEFVSLVASDSVNLSKLTINDDHPLITVRRKGLWGDNYVAMASQYGKDGKRTINLPNGKVDAIKTYEAYSEAAINACLDLHKQLENSPIFIEKMFEKMVAKFNAKVTGKI